MAGATGVAAAPRRSSLLVEDTRPLPSVIVIDDDEIDRRVAVRCLGNAFQTRVFSGGDEALLAASAGDPPDCAIVDFHIPGTDTLALVRELVARSIAVVMLTGHGSEPVAVQTMQSGAFDYLTKHQLSADSLRRAVSNAIEKHRLALQLREQQREMQWFASIAAHDLRAPLRRMIQFVDVARMQGSATHPELADTLGCIQRDARRLLDLVDGLSRFMKAGHTQFHPVAVDLNEVAAKVLLNVDLMREERRAEIEIRALPRVLGDPTGLLQLLQNLIGNAIKYAGDPPVIRVEARREDDGFWRIGVADNGPGIPADRREDIFRPFQRLSMHAEVEGSGLGLAICRRIIERHRGRIWIEDNPTGGTVFCVSLPAAER